MHKNLPSSQSCLCTPKGAAGIAFSLSDLVADRCRKVDEAQCVSMSGTTQKFTEVPAGIMRLAAAGWKVTVAAVS